MTEKHSCQNAPQVSRGIPGQAVSGLLLPGNHEKVRKRTDTGIRLNRDRTALKLYFGDTGLLISHAFDENGLVTQEMYKKLLFGRLEVNEGMLLENIAAQMLTASGHRLYFYSNSSRNDKNARMEIDFLITGRKITGRHNASATEVKSGTRYTYSSLRKFMNRYRNQPDVPCIPHTAGYPKRTGQYSSPYTGPGCSERELKIITSAKAPCWPRNPPGKARC